MSAPLDRPFHFSGWSIIVAVLALSGDELTALFSAELVPCAASPRTAG